jgi:hypothetical protein
MPEVYARIDERFDQFGLIRCHDTPAPTYKRYNEQIGLDGSNAIESRARQPVQKATTAKKTPLAPWGLGS